MKINGKVNLLRDGAGNVNLEPEEEEDLWHLYNLVQEGDRIRARTTRKVKLENASGNVDVRIKKLVLTIEVTKIEYEPNDHSVRFSGRNIIEHEDVKLGQFHTLEIGVHDSLNLDKDDWDFACRERLKECSDARVRAEVAAVLIEQGTAALYVLTSSLVKDCGRAHGNLAKNKQYGKADKSKIKFFELILGAMRAQFNLANMKCVLIGGPGDMKDQFFDWLFEASIQKGLTDITSRRKIFLKSTCSGVSKSVLAEVLQDPAVASKMSDTKALGEVGALGKFWKMHNECPLRACYGPAAVALAAESSAIEVLLISDELFRSSILKHRVFYSHMAQEIKDVGGQVCIVSGYGVTGEQMKNLSGIAAVLRWPLNELEDLEPGVLPEALR
eukprot:Protomagalhaensia_wolfi_Nauph_80__4272@NODE_435_length_2522_cov_85_209827_g328_i0_p1_GENE_NODE_435_length_2522_cov_85_209827_g328_i0NODE_435_length_2522_cov_85_209827_g328_i0_p1_ORF_typecomplete_len386_score83_30eRF1_1/PF03463_15/2_8e35eRF1_3/PF03465_15/1_9e17eRF1_2/PF03464_15/6e15_NODE_435_length_2522_cov_85_209827_g328_i02071364